jgi:asparagine synthase (glutamine-hydrolysing)
MLSYGGSYAGAYLLRRSVLLPFELKTVLNRDVIEDGLRRLVPLKIVRGSMHPRSSSPAGRVAALESSNYMRNQLLRDADWAGMAHSLEIRTPLVDIELLRAIAPLIPHLRPAMGKAALAAAPSQPLPSSIRDRRKTGFVVPTGRWTASASAVPAGSKGAASRAWAKVVISDAAASLPRDAVAVG